MKDNQNTRRIHLEKYDSTYNEIEKAINELEKKIEDCAS